MKNPESTSQLLNSDPFDFSKSHQDLFRMSFVENASHHYDKHEFTRKLWDKLGFHPSQIKTEADLATIPGTMVHLYKEHEFCSVKKEDLALILTSSGTGGQRSQQFLDQLSLDMSNYSPSIFIGL